MCERKKGSRIKLCGLSRECDIAWANELVPDYVGFVFARGSRRYLEAAQAEELRRRLRPDILPVGVFVDAPVEEVGRLWDRNIIAAVQLHGAEDAGYIRRLRARLVLAVKEGEGSRLARAVIWQAFQIRDREDIRRANASEADLVLVDSGSGSGKAFDWSWLGEMKRPYMLAGGLTAGNVGAAIREFHPFGVDASSSLETNGYKDREKMAAFVEAARESEER